MNGGIINADPSFLGLDQGQWMSLLRSVAKVVGSAMVTHEWATADQVSGFIADIPTWVGIGLTVLGLYTSHQAHSEGK